MTANARIQQELEELFGATNIYKIDFNDDEHKPWVIVYKSEIDNDYFYNLKDLYDFVMADCATD